MAKRSTPKGPVKESAQSKSHAAIDRWALVVGVSDYQFAHNGITPLQFSHRDAEQFPGKLISPAYSRCPEKNVRLLTNQHAALPAVQKFLQSAYQKFLKRNPLQYKLAHQSQ